jgi:transcriptional regulator with XRE-family HTH domain
MTKEQIGSFVKDERKRQKLSQQALADKAGFPRYQQILEIEKAQFDYGIDVLIKVMNGLGLEIRFLQPGQFVTVPLDTVVTSEDKPLLFDFKKTKAATEEDNPDKPVKTHKKVKKVDLPFKRSKT